MKSELSKNFSLVVIVIFFIGFAYITVKALQISNKTQISTGEGIYTNKVSTSKEIASKALELTKNVRVNFVRYRVFLTMSHTFPIRSITLEQTLRKEPYRTTLETVMTKVIY